MRRVLSLAASALLLTASVANAQSHFLDRSGVLWTAQATQEGLLLTGQADGAEIVRTTVPFAVALAGVTDTNIQVAADETTGSVLVVWQRNWARGVSEVLAARWTNGQWDATERLSTDVFANPRNPSLRLASKSTSVGTDDAAPITDSFAIVVWWEGVDTVQHGSLAIIRLTDESGDLADRQTYDLDDFIPLTISCRAPAPAEVLEHPLFASVADRDRALVFFGSEEDCFFFLLQVDFQLSDGTGGNDPVDGIGLVAQRRRHMPIFGVKKVFLIPHGFDLQASRIVVGPNLKPVAYHMGNAQLEYVVYSDSQWSAPKTLPITDGLTLDQAIPLVENLAR
jgi:hypothetical protein